MPELNLSPDDLPPTRTTSMDEDLKRQLEAAIARCLYEACDGVTQSILMSCQWYITTNTAALTLIIICPNASVHLRVLNNLVPLGNHLACFLNNARIRIHPPNEAEPPYELCVDEVLIDHDSLEMEG
ncbi:hypothetical protein [Leptothermofonsia sp. ETS-13]|uniref:hypothetical protein n=1 Tax=Leptothermofonsia sp. ETS-13 TaxID=3035696 RepID=UPI003B9F6D1F